MRSVDNTGAAHEVLMAWRRHEKCWLHRGAHKVYLKVYYSLVRSWSNLLRLAADGEYIAVDRITLFIFSLFDIYTLYRYFCSATIINVFRHDSPCRFVTNSHPRNQIHITPSYLHLQTMPPPSGAHPHESPSLTKLFLFIENIAALNSLQSTSCHNFHIWFVCFSSTFRWNCVFGQTIVCTLFSTQYKWHECYYFVKMLDLWLAFH